MQVRINLRCHQGWFDWVNEYNFQAGLQTWPNLNSQQRKSGWIEFSLSVINTRTASLEKVDNIRINNLFQFKMEELNCVQPEFWSKSIIFLLFVLTSPRSKSITCWVGMLGPGFGRRLRPTRDYFGIWADCVEEGVWAPISHRPPTFLSLVMLSFLILNSPFTFHSSMGLVKTSRGAGKIGAVQWAGAAHSWGSNSFITNTRSERVQGTCFTSSIASHSVSGPLTIAASSGPTF